MSIDHSGSISARAGAGRSREYHVDLPLWLANVEFARQVQTTGEEYKSKALPAPMQFEYPKRMLVLFASHEPFAFRIRRFRHAGFACPTLTGPPSGAVALTEAWARWTDTLGQASDNEGQFSERVGQTEGRTDIGPEIVEAPAEVLNEGDPADSERTQMRPGSCAVPPGVDAKGLVCELPAAAAASSRSIFRVLMTSSTTP